MVNGKSANAAKKALLARLATALNAGDDALRAVLGELGLTETTSTAFVNEAREVRKNVREQTPQASMTELELALGVLWVLRTRPNGSEGRVAR